MNARSLHQLYRRGWMTFSALDCEWENLLPDPVPDANLIEGFLRRHIADPTVFVHVSRSIGGEFEIGAAARCVCPYIGEYEIHIASRDFSSRTVIATPGVGAGVKGLPPAGVASMQHSGIEELCGS